MILFFDGEKVGRVCAVFLQILGSHFKAANLKIAEVDSNIESFKCISFNSNMSLESGRKVAGAEGSSLDETL